MIRCTEANIAIAQVVLFAEFVLRSHDDFVGEVSVTDEKCGSNLPVLISRKLCNDSQNSVNRSSRKILSRRLF